jgi:hypothetical protein
VAFHDPRAQVHLGEPGGHDVGQVGFIEPVELVVEVERAEHVLDADREAADVGPEVLAHVVLVGPPTR